MAAHNFVDNEHPWVCRGLVDDGLEEHCALFRRSVSPERLGDRVDVVINSLRKPQHLKLHAFLLEMEGQSSCGGIGVIATDRVQDSDPVLNKAVARNVLRVLARLHKLPLDAVLHVLELHAAVPNRRPSVVLEEMCPTAHFPVDLKTVSNEEALIAIAVAKNLNLRIDLGITLNQTSNSRGQTRRKAPRCEDADLVPPGSGWSHSGPLLLLILWEQLVRDFVQTLHFVRLSVQRWSCRAF
mmetsp:Transcript_4616/g.10853  ORF Transcript_4616/g.10853 Transcript_4616/m.10853 type:complete len:240 (+) Transcript_4616:776-1495(+)